METASTCDCGCGAIVKTKGHRFARGHNRRIPELAGPKLFGASNPQWKGDGAGVKSGRQRARHRYPALGVCHCCGEPARDRHHVDGNTLNNEPSNVLPVCRRCHMTIDGRLERLAKGPRFTGHKGPDRCIVCGADKHPLRKGRCHTCNEYWRRNGRERHDGGRVFA